MFLLYLYFHHKSLILILSHIISLLHNFTYVIGDFFCSLFFFFMGSVFFVLFGCKKIYVILYVHFLGCRVTCNISQDLLWSLLSEITTSEAQGTICNNEEPTQGDCV